VRLRGGRQRDERKRGDQRRSQSPAPESACTALRVEAARVTVWSWVKSVSRRVESFMSAEPIDEDDVVGEVRRHKGCGSCA